jgi:hypothetical protein
VRPRVCPVCWTFPALCGILRGMQALKLQVTVDDAVVQVLPALAALHGQHIELIALGEEPKLERKLPIPGALAGKIALKDNFDAPLPDDIRRSFEGDVTA